MQNSQLILSKKFGGCVLTCPIGKQVLVVWNFYLWVDYSSLYSVNIDKVYVMIPRERMTSAASLVYIVYVMPWLSILVHLQDNNIDESSPGS